MSFQPGRSASNSRIGTQVGGYTIMSLLGSGGYGSVYRAVGQDGTQVALKLVLAEHAHDETLGLRFAREAQIAQTIVNPHLVEVFATGVHEGLPYLAQKFIDGGSLETMLKREGTLPIATTVGICEQVASALDALAAAGIFHRDVKPANILLDRQLQAYLTDFGLAKDSQGANLTAPGQTLGSMDYMAPEQIRGQAVTAATDVYALGCVMFECVSGHSPFASRKGMEVLFAHLRDDPGDPCAERADAPPEFVEQLLLALAKDPDARPASAGAYARGLRQAAGL